MYRQILKTKLKVCVLFLVEIQRSSKIEICVLLCFEALHVLIVLPFDRSLCSAGRSLRYKDLPPLVDKNAMSILAESLK